MTTIVTRLFASADAGPAAVAALKAKKFKDSDIDVVAGGDGARAALINAGVYAGGADAYAAKLKDGGCVVVVRAPYGNAILANRVLDGQGPVASGVQHESVYVGSVDARPLYKYEKNLPELLPEGTLVLSEMMMPRAVISGEWTFSHIFGLPFLSSRRPSGGLTDNATPFSSALGLPLLSSREPKVRLIDSPPRARLID